MQGGAGRTHRAAPPPPATPPRCCGRETSCSAAAAPHRAAPCGHQCPPRGATRNQSWHPSFRAPAGRRLVPYRVLVLVMRAHDRAWLSSPFEGTMQAPQRGVGSGTTGRSSSDPGADRRPAPRSIAPYKGRTDGSARDGVNVPRWCCGRWHHRHGFTPTRATTSGRPCQPFVVGNTETGRSRRLEGRPGVVARFRCQHVTTVPTTLVTPSPGAPDAGRTAVTTPVCPYQPTRSAPSSHPHP